MDYQLFTLHRWCLRYGPVIWLHVTSDVVIAASYLAISATMLVALYRHRSVFLRYTIFWIFAAFILLCGATHAMGAWTMVISPDYLLEGIIKAWTGVVSLIAAVMLSLKVRYLAGFKDLTEYRETNHELRNTIAEHALQISQLEHLIREGNRSASLERQMLIETARESIRRIDKIVPRLNELMDQSNANHRD